MIYPLLRPLLFALDPETAHELTFASLDMAVNCRVAQVIASHVPPSPVTAMGLSFPNRVGLAAGLDKNAAHIDGLAALGFGFIECGTVTPRPQPGNPKPRLFRLPESEALINRLGFNNEGVQHFLVNAGRATWRGILGPQHRQELRHAERPRRRRLPRVSARRVRARLLRRRQHLVAEHEGPARPAVGGRARRAGFGAQGGAEGARRQARQVHADRGQDRARPRPPPSTGSRASWSATASTA